MNIQKDLKDKIGCVRLYEIDFLKLNDLCTCMYVQPANTYFQRIQSSLKEIDSVCCVSPQLIFLRHFHMMP